MKRFDRANSQNLGLKGLQRTHHKIRSLAHSHKMKVPVHPGIVLCRFPDTSCDTIFQATGAPPVLRRGLLHP